MFGTYETRNTISKRRLYIMGAGQWDKCFPLQTVQKKFPEFLFVSRRVGLRNNHEWSNLRMYGTCTVGQTSSTAECIHVEEGCTCRNSPPGCGVQVRYGYQVPVWLRRWLGRDGLGAEGIGQRALWRITKLEVSAGWTGLSGGAPPSLSCLSY